MQRRVIALPANCASCLDGICAGGLPVRILNVGQCDCAAPEGALDHDILPSALQQEMAHFDCPVHSCGPHASAAAAIKEQFEKHRFLSHRVFSIYEKKAPTTPLFFVNMAILSPKCPRP
ncbi:hypothetical protein [Sphingomonas sp. DBB INV C78]|uniref:hypothetical protein n=1 Tax=Sphingomonas sp. DBB INV C78 TaxID=3349434 RepID=UPI0036D23BFA